MSRSFKKSPVVCPSSSKSFNSKANRAMRCKVRRILRTRMCFDDLVLPIQREMSNVYDSPKDGRCNMFGDKMTDDLKKYLRK